MMDMVKVDGIQKYTKNVKSIEMIPEFFLKTLILRSSETLVSYKKKADICYLQY